VPITVGRFHPFYRPRRQLRKVKVSLYSVFRPRHYGSASRPGLFHPREGSGTHCTQGWVGPRAGLARYGKSLPHRDSIPERSSPQPVSIPTELPGPRDLYTKSKYCYIYIYALIACNKNKISSVHISRDSSIGIATRYGLEGPGMESLLGGDFLHPYRSALGFTQLPIQRR
jgi:hypothetical protein